MAVVTGNSACATVRLVDTERTVSTSVHDSLMDQAVSNGVHVTVIDLADAIKQRVNVSVILAFEALSAWIAVPQVSRFHV